MIKELRDEIQSVYDKEKFAIRSSALYSVKRMQLDNLLNHTGEHINYKEDFFKHVYLLAKKIDILISIFETNDIDIYLSPDLNQLFKNLNLFLAIHKFKPIFDEVAALELMFKDLDKEKDISKAFQQRYNEFKDEIYCEVIHNIGHNFLRHYEATKDFSKAFQLSKIKFDLETINFINETCKITDKERNYLQELEEKEKYNKEQLKTMDTILEINERFKKRFS